MDPCGTPDDTADQSEKCPLTTTLCRRVVRKDLNHCKSEPWTPRACNLSNKRPRGTELKALAKSIRTQWVLKRLFKASAQSCMVESCSRTIGSETILRIG